MHLTLVYVTLFLKRFLPFDCHSLILKDMAKQSLCVCFAVILISAILVSEAGAFTDPRDVTALQDLYRALNHPPQLKGWRSDGGDPCGESWGGVSCSGSSVIYLKLHGLSLSGYLTGELYNFFNLKQLDVSSNNIVGEIPYVLPPNATHINMACNYMTQNIPHSLPTMKSLRHLNLSHNLLSGPIGNVFTGLQNLRELDLSYNNFTGDLPSSFGSLTNLTGLYLQNNKFTGSVAYLAELPLTDMNIQDNYFSGIIPNHFQSIPNLWFGGNNFHVGDNSPPWDFPLQTQATAIEQNIPAPPATQSSAIAKNPSKKLGGLKKKRIGPGGIAFLVGGGTLVASCVALYITVRINQSRAQRLITLGSSNSSMHSLSVRNTAREESPQILAFRSPILPPRRLPLAYRMQKNPRRKSFSDKYRFPMRAKQYTVAELQLATNSFCQENLLGEGSLGSVYKAMFPDGQILAVKNINMAGLSFNEEEQFLNLSLHDALHSDEYKPLSWGLRLQIALGVAQALDYLHSTFTPPVAHSNLKSANILLDEELAPRICDCGLAILRPLTSNRLKLKASENAIGDTGYIAPEHGQPGIDSTKCDIYAYGVLLLELLTGRKPFDKTFSSKAISQFADIVSLCIQPVKEFRPPMSEVVGSLSRLIQKLNYMGKGKGVDGYGVQVDPFERSFRSTNSQFMGSPSMSYLSI
ncbi:protein STRUBBELIG-RECEPTOR FAMILY 2 [Prunus yedoensis var. nudiflora]|uniref:Protein STRUBBELIG-RECEPTOR FAMILY 2 n=1 Tax=Prunus yedoensis var. nudiflora TaxID=2094558 RepID=A0A314UYN7_PRUYE|nr:protein STRUBBELIG-RECEPTOR FAMILY 2 [Prunus yedoensis var. nudiflora]